MRKIILLYRRFIIWTYNYSEASLMRNWTYWLVTESLIRLGMRNNYVLEYAAKMLDQAYAKLEKNRSERNAYAYKHNLKPHPKTPDDWRERYEQENGIEPQNNA